MNTDNTTAPSQGNHGTVNHLGEMKPSDVLQPDTLAAYEKLRGEIWPELVRLNSTLFVLRSALDFPEDLLHPLRLQNFFGLLRINFMDIVVMIITRLSRERGSDTVTLCRPPDKDGKETTSDMDLKAFTLRSVGPELKPPLVCSLRSVEFDEDVDKKLDDAKRARDIFVAHLITGRKREAFEQQNARISLGDLQRMCQSLNELFHVLCFGEGHGLLPIAYDTSVIHPSGSDARPDVEYILDLLARDSPLLKMPEQQAGYWPHHRDIMSDADIVKLNEYRRKFGLPDA